MEQPSNPNHMIAIIKNAGPAPAVLYDVSSNVVRLAVGEKRKIVLPIGFVNRLRRMALQGGTLLVINESEAEEAGARRRVRLRSATLPPENVDAEAAEYVRLSQRDDNRAIGNKTLNPRPVVHPEIMTPEQLLAAHQDGSPLGYSHLLSVARRVLPEGTFKVHQPKQQEIISKLEAAVRARRR